MTDEEVAALGVETRKVEVQYSVGDSVSIIDGPLEGFIGTVEALDVMNNWVKVTVSMFGRETSVELEPIQVRQSNKIDGFNKAANARFCACRALSLYKCVISLVGGAYLYKCSAIYHVNMEVQKNGSKGSGAYKASDSGR